jgi:hypothetical protein
VCVCATRFRERVRAWERRTTRYVNVAVPLVETVSEAVLLVLLALLLCVQADVLQLLAFVPEGKELNVPRFV